MQTHVLNAGRTARAHAVLVQAENAPLDDLQFARATKELLLLYRSVSRDPACAESRGHDPAALLLTIETTLYAMFGKASLYAEAHAARAAAGLDSEGQAALAALSAITLRISRFAVREMQRLKRP